MTVSTTGNGGTVQTYRTDEPIVGLEDVDASDLSIPRLKIIQREAVFEDSLTKARYPELDVIMLGQVKQRISWRKETDPDEKPRCKSTDFVHGFPMVSEDIPTRQRFPWAESGFNPANFPPNPQFNNLVTLPCADCQMKEWGADSQKPLCGEQFTFPVMYLPEADGEWTTALLTFQSSGLKPARTYVSGFIRNKTPMFTTYTNIKLNLVNRGTVDYSVPTFRKGDPTDRERWQEMADTYRSIREWLQNPPLNYDAAPEIGDNTNSAPATVVVPAPIAQPVQRPVVQQVQQVPTPAPAPVAVPLASTPVPVEEDDDALPF